MSRLARFSDPEWLLHYIAQRFGCDDAGRMTPALGCDSYTPHFVLGRSAQGNIWRFSAGLPDRQVRDLARLAGREPAIQLSSRLRIAELPPPERLEPLCVILRDAGLAIQSERRCLLRELSAAGAVLGDVEHFEDSNENRGERAVSTFHSIPWPSAQSAAMFDAANGRPFADLILFVSQ